MDSSRRSSFSSSKWILQSMSLGDVQLHLARELPGLLLDGGKLLADALVCPDLLHELPGFPLVAGQPDKGFLLDVIRNPPADLVVAELVLGLALEHRVFELDCHGPDHPLSHVLRGEGGARVVVYGLEDPEAEGGLVGASVNGELAVHEAEVAFPVSAGVSAWRSFVPNAPGILPPSIWTASTWR